VACWRRSKLEAVYFVARLVAREFRLLKTFVIKFRNNLGRWLFGKKRMHTKKALLIGIRHDDDPNTLALEGPHRDVQSLRQLLISE
jgi:hypothetical protein